MQLHLRHFALATFLLAAIACSADGTSDSPVAEPAANEKTPPSKVPCSSPQQNCGETCIDTSADVANCGGCGFACKTSETCVSAGCKGENGKVTCAPERTMCGDACIDITVDEAHCGGCDRACAARETCNASKCEPEPSGCAVAGQSKCATGCVDTSTDAKNCGVCGNVCDPGGTCVDKKCKNPPPAECTATETRCEVCAPGQPICATACFDLTTSKDNCGFCGMRCAADKICSDKKCVTP